eukprot:326784-Pyramimonas_sp.AAC.1
MRGGADERRRRRWRDNGWEDGGGGWEEEQSPRRPERAASPRSRPASCAIPSPRPHRPAAAGRFERVERSLGRGASEGLGAAVVSAKAIRAAQGRGRTTCTTRYCITHVHLMRT